MSRTVMASDIKTLAVCYEAFCEANRDDDESARKVWAGMLKDAQNKTGIIMMPESCLRSYESPRWIKTLCESDFPASSH